jgi:hypothetical protein
MSVEYPPATLRVAPSAIPAVRSALQTTLEEVRNHISLMQVAALIEQPWLGDSASHAVYKLYNQHVMHATNGPFAALQAYRDQLMAAHDALADAENHYRATEGDNSALWGRT